MDLALALAWYAVLLFSLTFHEAAHAWTARRGGDPTAYLGGQVSLDPRPHIRREPVGMVLAPLLAFSAAGWMIGWASTPYDPRWAHAHPRRAAWMSLAGPAANVALVLAAALLVRLGLALGLFEAPLEIGFSRVVEAAAPGGLAQGAAVVVSILFTLNLLLAVFNLLPVPPLDGSGVLGILLPDAAARRLRLLLQRPALALAGLLLAWWLVGPIFARVHLLAVNLLYPELGYG
jgi:Zn-dependent protease